MSLSHVLLKMDQKPIPVVSGEVRVLCVVRNEMNRLPQFLKYYRDKGIKRFLFIDNNSSDGSRDYLLGQNDCHVFLTHNLYREAKSGIAWWKSVLDEYGTGHWCLTVDADELLIYPSSETVSIPQLCEYLDQEGADALFTFLLDMYPKGSLEKAVPDPGTSFFQLAPYYDKDYAFVDRIKLRNKKPFPPQEVIGGPRARCFYPDQGANSYARRLYIHLMARGLLILRKLGAPVKVSTVKSPALFKVPLVKWKTSYRYLASTHEIEGDIKLSKVTGALAHFKFFADFHERVKVALQKKQFSDGSAEYQQYMARMDDLEKGVFFYEGSRKFENSNDLVEHNLMTAPDDFKRYATTAN